MDDLLGKVSIVTGSAQGIGKEVALRLARDGSDVVIVDIDRDQGREVADQIQSLGRRSVVYEVDVSRWDQIKAMVDGVMKEFGKVDILVNSAGILGPTVPVTEYSIDDWDRVTNIDLKGTFLICKAVVEVMLPRKSGRIVNLASIAGKEGNPYMCAYSASKAGVIAFTRALALEVAGDNIIVNSVAPTMIEGPLSSSMTEEQHKTLLSKIPMGRLGKTSEVAALIKYLVSEECTFSTGHCHDLSGGRAVY